MTSRELRKQRRREEIKARKAAYKAEKQSAAASPVAAHPLPVSPERPNLCDPALVTANGFSPEFEAYTRSIAARMNLNSNAPITSADPVQIPIEPAERKHTERNRLNAQFSTGPKSPEGKSASSKNAVRHGLSSNQFLILDWENVDDFHELLDNLRAEHQPATQTEALLVERMAQHFWLTQRALRLQDMCLRVDVPLCDQPKELALYLRYQTTHERAFHKCLAQLQKLRAEQRKAETGFVSQKHREAAETRKQELHQARLAALQDKQNGKDQRNAPVITSITASPGFLDSKLPLESAFESSGALQSAPISASQAA